MPGSAGTRPARLDVHHRRHSSKPTKDNSHICVFRPVICGWSCHYRTCTAKKIYDRMDLHLIHKLQHLSRD
ncbi:MAG: hypothetical protein KJ638_05595 [Chloroflexi bacterium]|nr:hypothetical protein [Chloroflexota bacterium]